MSELSLSVIVSPAVSKRGVTVSYRPLLTQRTGISVDFATLFISPFSPSLHALPSFLASAVDQKVYAPLVSNSETSAGYALFPSTIVRSSAGVGSLHVILPLLLP